MCFPCWPWTDVYLEDAPKKKKRSRGHSIVVWDPINRVYVRLTGVTVSLYRAFCRVVLSLSKVRFYSSGSSEFTIVLSLHPNKSQVQILQYLLPSLLLHQTRLSFYIVVLDV